MKTRITTLLLLALPFFVSAQTLTIESGASVTIGAGATMTTGEIDNQAGNSGLVIESTTSATQGNLTGSLIYSNAATEPDATVQVYVEDQGWHFVSSPAGSTTSDVFLSATDDVWLAEYDITSTSGEPWTYITSTTATINKGQGYSYAVNYSSRADNNVSFTGKLVSQNFTSPTLNYEDAVNTNPNNFTLIGNPFSAPIDIATFAGTETGIELSLWIWDQALNSGSGGFQWASVLGSYGPPSEMDPLSVALGQGFFVRAVQANATIDFDPSLRKHESAVKYFKKAEENEIAVIEFFVAKDNKKDFGAITFDNNGSTGFENGWDVSKMLANNGIPEIYFMEEGNRYCLNHLASLEQNDDRIVNMHFIAGETGEQKLTANLDKIPETEVYLEDLQTEELINLNQTSVYTFSAKKGDNPDRFRVHFKYSPTGVDELPTTVKSNLDVYASNKAVYITNKESNNLKSSKIHIYDMFGRLIYNTEKQLNSLTRIPLHVNNSYLVVRVISGNEFYTEKVFIK